MAVCWPPRPVGGVGVPGTRGRGGPDFGDEVASGDRRRGLLALRDRLAEAIEAAEPGQVAPLAKQLSDVLAQLDQLRVPEVSARDDLANRRVARRAAAKVQGAPGEGVVGGPGGD